MTEPAEAPHARDERYVWYCLTGEFDPDEVTEATGLSPTSTRRKGERASERTTFRLSASEWAMDSALGPSEEFHKHLEDVIDRLRPGWDALRALGQVHQAGVTAAIYCREAQGPLVEVVPSVALALVELNATLGFDIYALPERELDEGPIRPLTRAEVVRFGELRESKEPEQPDS
jgi:hypothetical protein